MIKMATPVNGLVKINSIICDKCDILIHRVTGEELEHFLFIHSNHIIKVIAYGNVLEDGKIGRKIKIDFENGK